MSMVFAWNLGEPSSWVGTTFDRIFPRVFFLVRVEQKPKSVITSPLYITKPNILSSHLSPVVPSCFCQTLRIPFSYEKRGLLHQGLHVLIGNELALVRVCINAARWDREQNLPDDSVFLERMCLFNGPEGWYEKNLINSLCRETGLLSCLVF
jgi:hypothetical protein